MLGWRREPSERMTESQVASYALAKLIAILKAHAENGTVTDIPKLARALQRDIPGMSHDDLVALIENTIAVLGTDKSGYPPSSLN